MTSYPVFIIDVSSRQPVEAELLDMIGERQLLDWQFQWRRTLEGYLRRLADNGVTRQGLDWPQSWHWDWRAKIDEVRGLLADRRFIEVDCDFCGQRYTFTAEEAWAALAP